MPPKSKSSGSDGESKPKRRRQVSKDTTEYVARRERNNVAVKKSREKSRAKAKNTVEKVTKLKQENETLEQQVTILSKELGVLKDLFKMVHSGTDEDGGVSFGAMDIKGEVEAEETSHKLDSSQDVGLSTSSQVKPKGIARRISNVNTEALQKDHEYFTTKR